LISCRNIQTKKSATGLSGHVLRSLDRDREEGMLFFAAVMSGKFLYNFLSVNLCHSVISRFPNSQAKEHGRFV
jgi:hypothetical protein